MVKRYLGAALVAFVLGCVGPLTVGAAQAAEEPDDAPSLLESVTGTLGSLTSGDADAEPDVDGPEPEPDGQEPVPEPGESAPPGPEPAEPEAPGTNSAPDTNGSGALGAVTTTVNRLADAPRNLLTDVADDAPTPEAPTPGIPVEPDTPEPNAPEPPADTPAPPDKPESPGHPETPGNPEPPASTDTPAGPPANAAPALSDVNPSSVIEPEQTAPALASQSITQPDTAEPERTQSQRPRRDVPVFLDPTEATGGNPAEQDKPAARPPQDVRAETISLRHVTQTPFVLAIALLTAVGVVTIRRVITVK